MGLIDKDRPVDLVPVTPIKEEASKAFWDACLKFEAV